MSEILFEVSVTAIIRRKSDDRMLILQRSMNKKRFPGLWTVPGGHIDQQDYVYETPNSDGWWYNVLENTVQREVREETGLRVENFRYLTNMVGEMKGKVLVISMVADIVEPWDGVLTLNPEESIAFAWVTPAEAKGYKLIEGIQEELVMAAHLEELLVEDCGGTYPIMRINGKLTVVRS